MTTLQSLVTSKDLSEKLRGAGYNQSHAYCYSMARSSDGEHELLAGMENGSFLFYLSQGEDIIARPTSDELLAVLRNYDFSIRNLNHNTLEISSDSSDDPDAGIYGATLAEVLAQFYLVLVEQGHIKREETI